MVIDSSAVLAILRGEPEAQELGQALAADPLRLIAAPTLLECAIVLTSRHGDAGVRELDLLVHRAGLDTVPFDSDHYAAALDAYRRFGKGRHPAALNCVDCMSYALAASTGEPLLFIGDDFGRTDVAAVEWRRSS